MIDYKVGDIVKWCWSETHQNTYIIQEIQGVNVILKQNFGGGTILSKIHISEISKKTTQEL